jgi:hypothetical protein
MVKRYSDAYHSVILRPGTAIVYIARSALPYASPADIERSFDGLNRALDGVDRGTLDLLVDIRAVVGRNDPEFEAAVGPPRARLMRGFRRVAFLVGSIAGQLQVMRHSRQDGLNARAFLDENAALLWLQSTSTQMT